MPKKGSGNGDDEPSLYERKKALIDSLTEKFDMEQVPFIMNKYPLTEKMKCPSKWRTDGADYENPNLHSLFVPSMMSEASITPLDFSESSLRSSEHIYSALCILDVCLTSLDNFSGTRVYADANNPMPMYPDITDKGVIVNWPVQNQDGEQIVAPHYIGKYYMDPEKNGFVPRCVVVVEMLFNESAFPPLIAKKLQDHAADFLMHNMGSLEDPLRHEDAENDTLSLVPHLSNMNIVGFLFHFVGMDPRFSLRECVLKQITGHNKPISEVVIRNALSKKVQTKNFHSASEARVIENSVSAMALHEMKASLPKTDMMIYDITTFIRLVNDFRGCCDLEPIPVPDMSITRFGEEREEFSNFFHTLPLNHFVIPWKEDEMIDFLKRSKVNAVQCLPRTYNDHDMEQPYFYIALPPFAFIPLHALVAPYTMLPTHAALSSFKKMGLLHVYSDLYLLSGAPFQVINNMKLRDVSILPNGKRSSNLQPFERVSMAFTEEFSEFWKRVRASDNPLKIMPELSKIREGAFAQLMQFCSDKSATAKSLYSIKEYLNALQSEKKSMCYIQPVFDDQDHVGNALWNTIFNLNLGNNIFILHTSVHLMLLAARSLWMRSFVNLFTDIFPFHVLFMSMPSLGKSFLLTALKQYLCPETYEEFHGFTEKAFTDSNPANDYVVYVCDETKGFMCGEENEKDMDKQDIWKAIIADNSSADKRNTRVKDLWITHNIDITIRPEFIGATNVKVRYSNTKTNAVLQRKTVKIFPQVYCNTHNSWASVNKDEQQLVSQSFKKAVGTIFRNQHAFVAMVASACHAKLLRNPDMNLINLLIARLISSNSIYSIGRKPSHRVPGAMRTLYLTIVLDSAYHFLHHNPCSPWIRFYDEQGQPVFYETPTTKSRHNKTQEERDENDSKYYEETRPKKAKYGQGGFVDYKPFEMKDILIVQPMLGPSITAAIHAISAFVMDNPIAVLEIFKKLLEAEGLFVDHLRRGVRELDRKRVFMYNMWSEKDEIEKKGVEFVVPFEKRPKNHPTRTQVLSSMHHTEKNFDPITGDLLLDSVMEDKTYKTSIYNTHAKLALAMDIKKGDYNKDRSILSAIVKAKFSDASPETIEELTDKMNSACENMTLWNIRTHADYKKRNDGLETVRSLNPFSVLNYNGKMDFLYKECDFKLPPRTTKGKLGFAPGSDPYAQKGIKPIMDFPLFFDSKTGKNMVRVDELVMCLTDLGEFTKMFSSVLRASGMVDEKDLSIDSAFLSEYVMKDLTLELPRLDPIEMDLVPSTLEEWSAHVHPDNLVLYKPKVVKIFSEIGSDDQGTLYDNLNPQVQVQDTPMDYGKSDQKGKFKSREQMQMKTSWAGYKPQDGASIPKKMRYFRVNLIFCMLTPQALGEILVKTLTSKFTLLRKNIPLLCPDPERPCSFLAVDVVPGNATNISTMEIASDDTTLEAMQSIINDMNHQDGNDNDNEDNDTIKQSAIDDESNPFIQGEDEEIFFTKIYNKSIGNTDEYMTSCPYNTIDEMKEAVREARKYMGKKESKITTSAVKGGVIDAVLQNALKKMSVSEKKASAVPGADDQTEQLKRMRFAPDYQPDNNPIQPSSPINEKKFTEQASDYRPRNMESVEYHSKNLLTTVAKNTGVMNIQGDEDEEEGRYLEEFRQFESTEDHYPNQGYRQSTLESFMDSNPITPSAIPMRKEAKISKEFKITQVKPQTQVPTKKVSYLPPPMTMKTQEYVPGEKRPYNKRKTPDSSPAESGEELFSDDSNDSMSDLTPIPQTSINKPPQFTSAMTAISNTEQFLSMSMDDFEE